jgi:copper chaperone
MARSSYTVRGMTCGHCVRAVTEEISQVHGVRAVEVDLATGGVTVTSDRALSEPEIRAAVTEAGYELAR